MGLFDKLFKKKENSETTAQKPVAGSQQTQLNKGDGFISFADDLNFRVIRPLTDEHVEQIEASTIPVLVAQAYMHYRADDLVNEDPNDQNWQNQVLFFWKAEEPFPKKSLPPIFETYKVKNFVFVKNNQDISVNKGQAIPWFGMPGMGEKHVCEIDNKKVSIPELSRSGAVQYIEPAELSTGNANILQDHEHYFYIVDERMVQFKNNNFYVRDTIIPIHAAYQVGGIHIVKKSTPE